jgi:hypothetical protein
MSKTAAAMLLASALSVPLTAYAEVCPAEATGTAEAKNGASQWCGCPISAQAASAANALDLDHRVTDDARFLDTAKAKGVRTIFRYYDWEHRPGAFVKLGRKEPWELIESSCEAEPKRSDCEKVVTKAEIAAIHAKGLDVGVVFQHDMANPETWLDTERAAFDARRALHLAHELGQPAHTTIFFGVDGAEQSFFQRHDPSYGMAYILRYFRVVNKTFENSGYAVGVYGSGLVCDALVSGREKLAKYCWLSMSTGHTGSRLRERAGAWTIKQCFTRRNYGGSALAVDPDIVSPADADFGQWRAK